uniref:Uncharacterized protein n=1 Tax=Timema monikensis TaxID=170555 RepID=A0A7R9HSX6_9NEOP|nr:unnamed protein product [Timema monikensis]
MHWEGGKGDVVIQSSFRVPTFAWRKSSKPFRKNHHQYTRPGLNHDLTVIGNLVYCESSTLDHAAIEMAVEWMSILQLNSLTIHLEVPEKRILTELFPVLGNRLLVQDIGIIIHLEFQTLWLEELFMRHVSPGTQKPGELKVMAYVDDVMTWEES